MAPADAAWLGLDRPEHLMVVTAVLSLRGRVELAALRELVAERLLAAYPSFAERPQRSRVPLGLPAWVPDEGFAVERHVVGAELDGPLDGPALTELVAREMATALDLRHAPWRLTLGQGTDGRSAVVARAHHALADGLALVQVLLRLVDQTEPAGALTPPGEPPGSQPGADPGRSPTSTQQPGPRLVLRAVAAGLHTVATVLGGPADSARSLRAPASVGRDVAWSAPLDLEAVKSTGKALGATVNDLLMSAVAGGLRTLLLDRAGPVGQQGPATDNARSALVRAMVPVDLRGGAAVGPRLGNRFGIVFLPLPVSLVDARDRVAAMRAAMTRAKQGAAAPASYILLSLVGLGPRWSQGLAARLLSRVATVIVTNVPGPREELVVAGVPLDSVVFWVPHIGSVGIGVSVVSYAGTVTVGVAVNTSLGIQAAELVSAVVGELDRLHALG